jgi:hypothetical protein
MGYVSKGLEMKEQMKGRSIKASVHAKLRRKRGPNRSENFLMGRVKLLDLGLHLTLVSRARSVLHLCMVVLLEERRACGGERE